MKNIEKRKIIIKGQSLGKSTELPLIAFGNPTKERNDFSIAISINAIREDERKSLFNRFSDRLETLADTAALKRMNTEEIINLIRGESERFSNAAAELNHV